MNVTNWGIFGSMPKSEYPMAEVPSAQYPASSGVEYLYAAGLWVGAVKNGIPSVSTGYPETEFRPPQGALYTIYSSQEGDLRGDRFPGPADDDGDGRYDEDWLNGLDDDGDGYVDEDFAASGKQMFSCWFTDDQESCSLLWPEHRPLNVHIRQESYQWGEDLYDDFVGVRYLITNQGREYLSSVYLGIYADLDAGPRTLGSYYMDDQVGYWEGVWCAPKGEAEIPVRLYVAYVYDHDGDDGRTPGYFGIAVLGHTTSLQDNLAPPFPLTSVVTFRTFRGLQPYESGGDATNDYERYDAISTYAREPNTDTPGDYRILISIGSFPLLPPHGSIEMHLAYVGGTGLEEMLDNAAAATIAYQGCYYNLDGDDSTGIDGRESPMVGRLADWDPDPCDGIDEKYDVPKLEICWSNMDCYLEQWAMDYNGCYKNLDADPSYYQTGVDGKEAPLRWVTGSAPTPPHMRVVSSEEGIVVLWDDLSETTPDAMTLAYDFEGYEIWRADNWHRPLGTSKSNGPNHELWSFLETRDLINGISPDRDFKKPVKEGGWEYTPLQHLWRRDETIKLFEQALVYFPRDTVPCPPGLTDEECDTLEAIARLNLNFEGGKRYYRYLDGTAKKGLPYFYSVVPYDHVIIDGVPAYSGRHNSPSSNFKYIESNSEAQNATSFQEKEVYVVPNPATLESMEPWRLGPCNEDPSGYKIEFRNLPRCWSTIRIFTVSGDLVITLAHDGRQGDGTESWNLISRNGQDIGSGVYLFCVNPQDQAFPRTVGKFVVIR
ncbi:MAG: hypothetical protein JXB45_07105 [Candidatus Krumholzibacteriota bacterium]|nr:hypothetical protein [Candidatus Krumholzibacteriota bacterium]